LRIRIAPAGIAKAMMKWRSNKIFRVNAFLQNLRLSHWVCGYGSTVLYQLKSIKYYGNYQKINHGLRIVAKPLLPDCTGKN
jgi:hypothetical protein